MTINLVALIVLVILTALAYWVINELITEPKLRKIFIVVLVVIVVLALLGIFGLLGTIVIR